MKLEKGIKTNKRFDIKDRFLYEKMSAICPICGENVLDYRASGWFNATDNDWLYKVKNRRITFKCPKCGCQWNVKPFKE